MEESILGITKLVNALFGKAALALLSALHIQPSNPQYPIPNHIAMELLVFALAAVFFLWLRARLSVERPGGTQQVMELLLRNPMSLGVADLLENNIGHGAMNYLPMIGSIGHLRLVLQSDQRGAGAGFANGGSVRSSGLRDRGVSLLPLVRAAEAWAACITASISWGRISLFRR